MHAIGKPHHHAPSKRSEKREARKQLAQWEDPNEPGSLAAPPRSPAADSAGGGKDFKHRPVRTDSPAPAGGRSLAAAAAAPDREPGQAADAPRKPLCSRATKWLAGITGLALIGAATRYAGTHLLAASSLQELLPDRLLPHEGAWASLPPLATKTPAVIPAPPGPLQSGPVDLPEGAVGPRTLRQSLDEALAQGDSNPVEALSLRLGAQWPRPGLPLATTKQLVALYRNSKYWRDVNALRAFMEGVMLAITPTRLSDEHINEMLKVWSWRYGEAQPANTPGSTLKVEALALSFVWPLASFMGGPAITDAKLRLLIEAACREPEDIPAGSVSDRKLSQHAGWASTTLVQITRATSPSADRADMWIFTEETVAQLVRCLRAFLNSPSEDRRWKALVVTSLNQWSSAKALESLVPGFKWEDMLLREVRKYVAATVHEPLRIRTMQEAVTALYDPERVRKGHTLDFS